MHQSTPHETRAAGRGRRLAALVHVLTVVSLLWVVEAVDAALPTDLDQYGIVGRTQEGARGILLSPFLHGGFGHLAANTLPLLVLGGLVALEGRRAYWKVTGGVGVLGGVGTWLLSPPGVVVVGASGVVFGYLTYLVARGAISRRAGHVMLSLLVAGVYGTLILGVLPSEPGVSWQAHLAGAAAGVVVATTLHRRKSAT